MERFTDEQLMEKFHLRTIYGGLVNKLRDKRIVKGMFSNILSYYQEVSKTTNLIETRDKTVERYQLDPSQFHYRTGAPRKQSPHP